MIIPKEYRIDSKQVQDRFKVISKIFESQFQRTASIGERREDGRTFQESFHIMCLGQGLDGKGWRCYKKEVMNKEGKEEPRKRGMIESEKREGEMTNKVEKEKPSEKISKASEASFWDFFRGLFLFHFIGHPFVLFSGSVVPLFIGSSFPSLLFTSFLHDLQPLLSRPCPWHMMRNDSWEVLPSPHLSTPSQVC